jgi:hypothetical protein
LINGGAFTNRGIEHRCQNERRIMSVLGPYYMILPNQPHEM